MVPLNGTGSNGGGLSLRSCIIKLAPGKFSSLWALILMRLDLPLQKYHWEEGLRIKIITPLSRKFAYKEAHPRKSKTYSITFSLFHCIERVTCYTPFTNGIDEWNDKRRVFPSAFPIAFFWSPFNASLPPLLFSIFSISNAQKKKLIFKNFLLSNSLIFPFFLLQYWAREAVDSHLFPIWVRWSKILCFPDHVTIFTLSQ